MGISTTWKNNLGVGGKLKYFDAIICNITPGKILL